MLWISSGRKKGSNDATAIFCKQTRQYPPTGLCVAPSRDCLPHSCSAGHAESLFTWCVAPWTWDTGSCTVQPQALCLGRLVDGITGSGDLPHVSALYSGQPGTHRSSSCYWTGAARHCVDGPPRLYKGWGTDTGILCCGDRSHRIPAGSTSHAVYCGFFRSFPLAPWIWPLCAWTGFSGCERENIPGGAYENESSSWE